MRPTILLLAVVTVMATEHAEAREHADAGTLQVEPASLSLQGRWATQRLLVSYRGSDGSLEDWSGKAVIQSANTHVVDVDAAGVVHPVSDGETAISINVASGASRFQAMVPAVVRGSQNGHADFGTDVAPLLSRLGCNLSACHGSVRGQGGLKLSLFGAEPDDDFAALTLAAHGRRINRVEPVRSLLVAKTQASTPHKGGKRLDPGSRESNLILAWITEGAPRGGGASIQVTSLEILPGQRIMKRGQTQRFLVTAVFEDGTRRDVSGLASFRSTDPKVVAIEESGLARVDGFGEAAVVAQCLRQSAISRVVVPSDLPFAFPDVPASNRIDELVFAKLKLLGIPPSELCSDVEFLRRVSLDVIGTLPAPEEVRAFLADRNPAKRSTTIDRLLQRPEFAQFWAIKWGDLLRIKSEYPVNVWPKAVHAYHRWLRTRIAQNQPYDQFVRELLTSGGSNFRSPAANYYRAMPGRDPQSFAEATALVFMGMRVNCAHCHGHPTEPWSEDDNLGLSAFFSKVAFKATQEWKEEIVYFNADGGLWHPRRKTLVKPKVPGGQALELGPEVDPRVKFAEWLTHRDNPWFATSIVNRVWYWLLGRGIVEPVDDLRPTNPPENPELLAYLRKELVDHAFDLKHVYRLILNSRVYQLSSETNRLNENDAVHFSHYRIRRLTAEQLLDAVCQVTGSQESFASWIPVPILRLPAGHRAIELPDSDIDSAFLDLFGRPSRDTAYEADRSGEAQPRQALYMVSSDDLEWKIAGGQRIKHLLESKLSDSDVVEEVYLAALSRPPRNDEKLRAVSYLARNPAARAQSLQDLLWAVLTTKEFMVNH